MSLQHIIKEEIQNYLNESYALTDDRFTFTEKLQNSYFYGFSSFSSQYDSDIVGSDINVTWKVSFWLNQMGIENFIVDVEKVEGIFYVNYTDKQTDEIVQENIQKNINDFEWKFILANPTLVKGSSLYISELEFDFKEKTCNVKF
jgi:hypothetical protein